MLIVGCNARAYTTTIEKKPTFHTCIACHARHNRMHVSFSFLVAFFFLHLFAVLWFSKQVGEASSRIYNTFSQPIDFDWIDLANKKIYNNNCYCCLLIFFYRKRFDTWEIRKERYWTKYVFHQNITSPISVTRSCSRNWNSKKSDYLVLLILRDFVFISKEHMYEFRATTISLIDMHFLDLGQQANLFCNFFFS